MIRVFLHDLQTELRRKYAFGGILLYVASAVYVTYLAFLHRPEASTWNALYWIVMLFAAVNAAAKSFMAESKGKMLYYYFTADPRSFILGKILYNSCLLWIVGLLCYVLFVLLHGDPMPEPGLFLIALLLGCPCLAGILTLMSAIASKSGHNFTLLSILSFPLLLPLMLMVIRLTHFSISGMDLSLGWKYIASLTGLNALVFGLAYLLFPYLWRE